jgi:hypothetical protein
MMDKGISMNGEPMGGMSMNVESLPVAQGTPIVASATDYPVQNPAYPMLEQEKVGSKCCGCCCDFRRAVIILDCCLIFYSVMTLFSLAFPDDVRSKQFEVLGIDDDQVQDVLLEMLTITQIIAGCGVVAFAIAAFGAKTYHTGLVAFGIAYLVLSFVALIVVQVTYTGKANDVAQPDTTLAQPITNWITNGVLMALFIYPHVGLISEIKSGIMSAATYPREEYSCCCGPN